MEISGGVSECGHDTICLWDIFLLWRDFLKQTISWFFWTEEKFSNYPQMPKIWNLFYSIKSIKNKPYAT